MCLLVNPPGHWGCAPEASPHTLGPLKSSSKDLWHCLPLNKWFFPEKPLEVLFQFSWECLKIYVFVILQIFEWSVFFIHTVLRQMKNSLRLYKFCSAKTTVQNKTRKMHIMRKISPCYPRAAHSFNKWKAIQRHYYLLHELYQITGSFSWYLNIMFLLIKAKP